MTPEYPDLSIIWMHHEGGEETKRRLWSGRSLEVQRAYPSGGRLPLEGARCVSTCSGKECPFLQFSPFTWSTSYQRRLWASPADLQTSDWRRLGAL